MKMSIVEEVLQTPSHNSNGIAMGLLPFRAALSHKSAKPYCAEGYQFM